MIMGADKPEIHRQLAAGNSGRVSMSPSLSSSFFPRKPQSVLFKTFSRSREAHPLCGEGQLLYSKSMVENVSYI